MTVTMVTVGYGDMSPTSTNPYEIILSIITMLIACGVFVNFNNFLKINIFDKIYKSKPPQKPTFCHVIIDNME